MRVEGRSKTRAMLRPASESAPRRSLAPGFQRRGTVEQLAELEGAELFAGEEVTLQAADTTGGGIHRRQPGTSSTAATFRPIRPSSPGARDCCGSTSETRPTSRSTATWSRSSRATRKRRVGRRPAAGVPASLCRSARRCVRRRSAPRAHLAQLARPPAHLLARRNPDLIASGEGGSNLTLVRVPGRRGGIVERRELAIHADHRSGGRWRLPAPPPGASASPTCTRPTTGPTLATADVLRAAEAATEWAGDSPLLFGGDLNLRPGRGPRGL